MWKIIVYNTLLTINSFYYVKRKYTDLEILAFWAQSTSEILLLQQIKKSQYIIQILVENVRCLNILDKINVKQRFGLCIKQRHPIRH